MATNKRLIKSNDDAAPVVPTSFNTVTYTGNFSTNSITGVGFQPDLVWGKLRDFPNGHFLFDSVRGVGNYLSSNLTNAEGFYAPTLTSFDSDGFTLGADNTINKAGYNAVAWCWKAGGAAVTNTDGSITSQVSANTEAGFSIVSWNGSSSNGTLGHGLGSAPKMIIVKNRSVAIDWTVYSESIGNTSHLYLNSTNAAAGGNFFWNATSPTNSVFSVSSDTNVNNSLYSYIAYCFAEVAGFSKFGSYVGNGVARTISLDFTPAFVMIKRTGTTGSWQIFDNKRSTYRLIPNDPTQELQTAGTNDEVTLVANGFTLPTDGGNGNNSALAGNTYIYMAFANQF